MAMETVDSFIKSCMEKAGMKMVRSDKGALEINGKTYDKQVFEYARQ